MNRVKEFRERRGFATETLAERVGVSERFLRALEADLSVASVEIGFKLAVALEAPFAELFALDGAPGADVAFGRVKTPSEPQSTEVLDVCVDGAVCGDEAVDVESDVCGDEAVGGDSVVCIDGAVCDDSVVCDDGAVDGDSVVCDDGAVGDDSVVCDDGAVGDEAVCGDSVVCDDGAVGVDSDVCVDGAVGVDSVVCDDGAVGVDSGICVDGAVCDESGVCGDEAVCVDSDVCVDGAVGVDSGVCGDKAVGDDSGVCDDGAVDGDSVVCGDEAVCDDEAALQRTALAAKKWAEKSFEIAAACDWESDEKENSEVGENGEKRRGRKKKGNGEKEAVGEIRRTRAPRRSEVKSSPTSKTAAEEGLAASPVGLDDPTAGRPIRFFDLFCGIGGFRFAAERTLAKMRRDGVCALSCDFDPPVQTSYEANFGERPFGDVAELPSEAIPDFDVLFAGFPCQAFSIIGLRKGFADETKGSLFFQIARILHDKRPRAFVLENVRQLTTHDGGRTFETILRILQEELGYCVDWRILNALDCGLPQKRERVAIVGALEPFEIAWPKPKTDGKTLADVLEPDEKIDKKYFASPEIVKRRKEAHSSQYFPAIWHENKSGNISSYPFSCALRAGASYNYLLVNGERRLTPREMLRLQGFPDSFEIKVSDTQIRKQAGNAAPVDLIERVLDRFLPLVFARGDAEPASNASRASAEPASNASRASAEPASNASRANAEPASNAIPGGLF